MLILKEPHPIVNVFESMTRSMNATFPGQSIGYWTEVPYGDGDKLYARKSIIGVTEVLVLHSDMLGQYGTLNCETDHRPFVPLFTTGFSQLFMPHLPAFEE